MVKEIDEGGEHHDAIYSQSSGGEVSLSSYNRRNKQEVPEFTKTSSEAYSSLRHHCVLSLSIRQRV
jgi:hypothetical protein